MSSLHHPSNPVQPDLFSEPFALYPPEWESLEEAFSGPDPADSLWWAQQGTPDATPPREPRLPLADWIEVKAQLVRMDGTDAARWLAGRMEELARLARVWQVTTPGQFDAAEEVMDDDVRDTLLSKGFDQGVWTVRPLI